MADPQGGTPADPGTPNPAPIEPNPTDPPKPAGDEPPKPAGDPPKPAGDEPPKPAGDEPAADDWATLRAKYAGDDEKLAKRLSRYSSIESALDALVAAQNKISSGALKLEKPGEGATDEELAAWRKQVGVPDDPSGYDLADLKLDDITKETTEDFLKFAHGKDMPAEYVKTAVEWSVERAEALIEARREEDLRIKEEGEESLREEWGSEFKLNKNLIKGLLDTAPEGVGDAIMFGRLADGTPITSDPKTLRWLASLAREINPTATVVPGSGTNQAQALESELATLKTLMADKQSEYWKGPKAEKNQKRYRELIDVQSKLNR